MSRRRRYTLELTQAEIAIVRQALMNRSVRVSGKPPLTWGRVAPVIRKLSAIEELNGFGPFAPTRERSA